MQNLSFNSQRQKKISGPKRSIEITDHFTYYVPTNSVAPLSLDKPTHNPQFLHSLWRSANALNVIFSTRYGGQFTLST